MKAIKAFLKPFEEPQRSVKIKIELFFFSSSEIGTGRVNKHLYGVHEYFLRLLFAWKSVNNKERIFIFGVSSLRVRFSLLSMVHYNTRKYVLIEYVIEPWLVLI